MNASFLSGTQCNHELWALLWPYLKSFNHYVDTIACNGFDAIDEQIDQHLSEHQPSHLVGFSMGGYAALHYALNHQKQIRSLVLIGTSVNGLSEEEKNLRSGYIDFLKKNDYKGLSLKRIQQFLSESNKDNEELIGIIKKMDLTIGKEGAIRQLETTTERVSLMGRLRELKIPVLLIGAQFDTFVDRSTLLEMKGEIKKSKFKLIKHSGHMLPLERPKKLAKTLNNWFEKYN